MSQYPRALVLPRNIFKQVRTVVVPETGATIALGVPPNLGINLGEWITWAFSEGIIQANFLSLTDVDPSTYTNHEGKFIKVNSTADGLDFLDLLYPLTDPGLGDWIITSDGAGNLSFSPTSVVLDTNIGSSNITITPTIARTLTGTENESLSFIFSDGADDSNTSVWDNISFLRTIEDVDYSTIFNHASNGLTITAEHLATDKTTTNFGLTQARILYEKAGGNKSDLRIFENEIELFIRNVSSTVLTGIELSNTWIRVHTPLGTARTTGSLLQKITHTGNTNQVEFTPYNFPLTSPGAGTYNLVSDGSNNFTFVADTGGLISSSNNGIVINSGVVQLGHTSTGSSTHDFTANRYQYLDTFDYSFGGSFGSNIMNISGNNGHVSWGTTIGSVTKYSFTADTDTGGNRGIVLDFNYDPDNTATNTYGIIIDADLVGTDQGSLISAFISVGQALNADISTTLKALDVLSESTLGTIGSIVLQSLRNQIGGTIVTNDVESLNISMTNTGTISGDMYGIKIEDLDSGTITGDVYAIYQGGDTSYNIFEGHTTFNGTTAPSEEVHIVGATSRLRFDNSGGINWGGTTVSLTGNNTSGAVTLNTPNNLYIFGSSFFGAGSTPFTYQVDFKRSDLIGSSHVVRMMNEDNTNAASHSLLRLQVGGASGGDPYILFTDSLLAVAPWAIGTDNSNSDKFTLSNNLTLGSNNVLEFTNSTGALALPEYGTGAITGTATYLAAFDANGNLIEELLSAVSSNVYNTSDSLTTDREIDLDNNYFEIHNGGSSWLLFEHGPSHIELGNAGIDSVEVVSDNLTSIRSGDGDVEIRAEDGSITLESEDITLTATIGAGTDSVIHMGNSLVSISTEIQLPDYGAAAYTGTATYYLAVDGSGNVIEEPVPGGSQDTIGSIITDAGTFVASSPGGIVTFTGGTGMDVTYAASVFTFTNTGTAYTAAEGLELSGTEFQLGSTVAGDVSSAFSVDRFINVDANTLVIETSGSGGLVIGESIDEIQHNNLSLQMEKGLGFGTTVGATMIIPFLTVPALGVAPTTTIDGSRTAFITNVTSATDGPLFLFTGSSFTSVSTVHCSLIRLEKGMSSASGGATMTWLEINAPINQSGTGITRGLHINQTLTSAADYRAIEVTEGISVFDGGNAASPGITFNNDLDTGLYSTGAGEMLVSVGGTARLGMTSTYLRDPQATGTMQIKTGSAGLEASPTFTFFGDTDTGIYRIGADNIGITTNSVKVIDIAEDRTLITAVTGSDEGSLDVRDIYVGIEFNTATKSTSTYWDADRVLTTGQVAYQGHIEVDLVADVDDWAPTDIASVAEVRVTTAGFSINGIDATGFATGSTLIISNEDPSNSLGIRHEEATSIAGNRFDLANNSDLVIPSGGAVRIYISGMGRWKVLGV